MKNRSDKSRIWIEGKKHDCKYEVDGGVVAGRIEGSETEVPVKAEIEIDIPDRRITLLRIVEQTT